MIAEENKPDYDSIVSKINSVLRTDQKIEAAYLLGSVVSGVCIRKAISIRKSRSRF